MTKKHFKELARMIYGNTAVTERNRIVKDHFMDDLIDYLKRDNKRFDEIKFRKMCASNYDHPTN